MSNDPYFRSFEQLRREKYEAGVREHRNGSTTFVGDPIIEMVKECADGVNFNEEALRQGLFEPWRARTIEHLFRQAAWLALGARADAAGEDA